MATKQVAEANGPIRFEDQPNQRETTVDALAFMDRFPPAKLEAIMVARRTNAMLDVWVSRTLAAGTVDLDDDRTVSGLLFARDAGLLTNADVNAIRGLP
jgi:hypothetical protein